MHGAWVEAAECGLHAGVVMIDMSAAFDVIDIRTHTTKENVKFSNSTFRRKYFCHYI